jgi:lambda repressor-like predicted transcriptional regulator
MQQFCVADPIEFVVCMRPMVGIDTPKKAATGRSRNDPPGQDWHPADVKAALEKAGWTFRGLARELGYSDHSAIARGLYNRSPVAEAIIAKALGKRSQEIWPSRYDQAGRPKGRFRPNYDPLLITRRLAGHVLNGGAL